MNPIDNPIIQPPAGFAHVGIDDCGSGDGKIVGWVAICLDPVASEQFSAKVKEIKNEHDISVFHGKEYHTKQAPAYNLFLENLKTHLLRTNAGGIRVMLVSEKEYRGFTTSATSVLSKALEERGEDINSVSMRQVIRSTPGLWLLAGETRGFRGYIESVRIEVDRSDNWEVLSEPISRGLSGFQWMNVLYNAHRNMQFPNAPRSSAVRMLPSVDSPLVQAADVVANFALAYVTYSLDKETASYRTKKRAEHLEQFAEEGALSPPKKEWFQLVNGNLTCSEDLPRHYLTILPE